jgi:hypothetical protein
MAFVGVMDLVTGYELSLSIFYLLPIALVTWRTPRWVAFTFCGVCAAVWMTVDHIAGPSYTQPLLLWNGGVRFGFFLVTSFLLSELRSHLLQEHALATIDGLTARKRTCAMAFPTHERHPHPR